MKVKCNVLRRHLRRSNIISWFRRYSHWLPYVLLYFWGLWQDLYTVSALYTLGEWFKITKYVIMENWLNIKITDSEVLLIEMIVQHVRNGKFLKGVSQKKEKEWRKKGKKGGREEGRREKKRGRGKEDRKKKEGKEIMTKSRVLGKSSSVEV